MRKIISTLLIFILCSSTFAQLRQSEVGNFNSEQFLLEQTESEDNALILSDDINPNASEIFPARGGSVDWGLALSGGGIRSGYYSIGVMKALYDQGYLDNIDVISSVSGGGYASYWLYTNYKKSGQKSKFGDSALSDKIFIQNVCYLQNKDKAQFVPTLSLFKIIFNSRGRAFRKYKEAIEKTFGNRTAKELNQPDGTRLDFLNTAIKSGAAPYFIINTTLRLKNQEDKSNPSRRLFEITPYFRGNADLEFRNWTETDKPLTLSESIAASAAPKWKIPHRIDSFIQNNLKLKKFYLSDGGHFENLAALSLIRRGVKNIIIVDAEEDATYEFAAYEKLIKLLENKNIRIKLRIPQIDEFLEEHKYCKKNKKCDLRKIYPNSVSIGSALTTDKNGTVRESKIYYIKMTQFKPFFPEKLIIDEQEKDNPAFNRGSKLHWEREELRKKGCENIKFNFEETKNLYSDLYTYRVLKYTDIVNNPQKRNPFFWGKMQFFKLLSNINPFFTYRFPHITTIDQSFFSNQAEAFVGLGYLQTKEMGYFPGIEPEMK